MKHIFQFLAAFFTMDWDGFIEADQLEERERTR